jgi:peptide/nickel transport system permease protein
VGIIATFLVIIIGTAVGIAAGYYRNAVDLVVMRLVEVLMCFPTFLLLLILMSALGDRQFEQSILVVIGVIGLTGWIGLAMLVRGETLKQRALPYIMSCEVANLPAHKIMFRHLLPNITGPVLISFSFGVAGAILAESGLSFLGFGVQPPTASWGGLLRQAFDNPLDYWHLTFFPGVALFLAVISCNFLGEGMRRALDVK